jgi:ABC-type phosphate transport system substrate-binding protein
MKKIGLLLLFAAFAQLGTVMVRAQAVVIANPDVKASSVSKSELRDIFTGAASSFSDGSHASPVLLKAGAVHDEFLSAYVGKNDTAFRASWRNLVFSGQASMPKNLDSESAMVEYVAHNPGAVGYVGKDTPHNGVKLLTVR